MKQSIVRKREAGSPKKRKDKAVVDIGTTLPFIDSMVNQHYALTDAELNKFFGWKIHKLARIVNLCVPDDDMLVNASSAISAISELNKMQGHYSPDKHINTNLNIDSDIEKVLDLVRKNKKEY